MDSMDSSATPQNDDFFVIASGLVREAIQKNIDCHEFNKLNSRNDGVNCLAYAHNDTKLSITKTP